MRWRPLAAAASTVLALAALPTPAVAAEPILPLAQVQPGMRCTGLTVVRGVEISSFDVEIIDVVDGDRVADQPLLLVRVSGPVAEPTGIAQGYSGSPVVCDGRIAGAIAYGTGDYGNELGLATPIEAVLGTRAYPPPTGVRRAPRIVRSARRLATPLMLTGIAPRVAERFAPTLRAAGVQLAIAPSAPLDERFGVQELRPGASMAVGLASGDVALGGVGTVTYVDGDRVWGFGHPFEAAGRRSLLLQDAYVYTVVDNPIGIEGALSYKLAAPGHDIGVLTGDGRNAVAGRIGPAAPTIPLRVVARNGATGERRVIRARLADESALDLPSGTSPSSLVVPMAVAQAAYVALDGSPARQSARMCMTIRIRQLDDPARFCNRFVGTFPSLGGPAGGPYIFDLYDALLAIDDYDYGTPDVESIDVTLDVEEGLDQAFLRRVHAPAVVRRGETVALRLDLQRYRGARFTRRVELKVPRDAPLGRRTLRLAGPPADGDFGEEIVITLDLDGEPSLGAGGPRSFAALGRRIERIHRSDGVVYQLRPGRRGQRPRRGARQRPLLTDRAVRISGSARADVRVLPARGRGPKP